MPDSPYDRLDRYLAGELSGPEQRDLARAALDDPDLFDSLTATGLVKAVLRSNGAERARAAGPLLHAVAPAKSEFRHAEKGASVGRFKERVAQSLAGVAAVAAIVALVIVYRSSSSTIRPQTSTSSASPATSTTGASAGTDSTGAASRPVLLTARLDESSRQPTATFRNVEADSRPPKSEGVIVSIDEGQVAVDLGSLDGLAKGSDLPVFRGREHTNAIGRLTIATVFRERSRGRTTSPSALQAGDRVEVAPAVHLAALLERAAARMAAGDTKSARALAEGAVSTSQAPGVLADGRRRALERLGTLEHRDGALDAAARHLQAAVDDLDAAPPASGGERAEVLNELGALLIERGDYPEAERMLRRAQSDAAGAVGARVANNLAALAALRGDSVAAESLYRSALSLAGDSPGLESDRRAIGENLEKLKAPR